MAGAFIKLILVDQERKLRDRRRSDTVVVLTVNYINQKSASIYYDSVSNLREIIVFGFWGEYDHKIET